MADKQLNCKGLACPQPVLETKKALAELPAGARLTVIVDNPAAKENVALFAANAGHRVEAKENGGEFILHIVKEGTGLIPESQRTRDQETSEKPSRATRVAYLISSNLFGQGSPDLGQALMKSLFVALAGQETAPEALIFINTGVYLSAQGSDVLDHLQALWSRGTTILSCGTCLEYYKLKEKLAVGRISNMYEIMEHLSKAEKVITIA